MLSNLIYAAKKYLCSSNSGIPLNDLKQLHLCESIYGVSLEPDMFIPPVLGGYYKNSGGPETRVHGLSLSHIYFIVQLEDHDIAFDLLQSQQKSLHYRNIMHFFGSNMLS